MIGEYIDRLVSVFAPATAAKRSHARRVFENTVARNYDGARSDRLNSHWRTANRSADVELLDSADIIRARVRDLVRNNAYAKGISKALVRNVVGCGIKPQARIPDNTAADERIEAVWARWQETADISGRLSFYEMQALAYTEVLEAGEVLVRYVASNDRRRVVPLAIELVEVDRFANDWFIRGVNPATGNEFRRGIEFNALGEPVTYWLYESHPNDLNSWRQQAKPYAAEQFEHLFRQERVGQTRGVSAFAPVLFWLKNLGYLVENELQATAVASCFTAVIKSMGGPSDGGLLDDVDTTAADTAGNQFEYMEPGLVARLMPGEDVQVINPQRSHSEAKAWIDLMVRSIAVGTGLSYERLSRDYSQTNYSSNRASDLEDRREFRPTQQWLERSLCSPTWRRFIEAGSEAGVDGFPSPIELVSMYDDWTSHIHQPPGWEWVDPAKEQKASAESIATNLSTLSDELGKRGKDWKDVLDQRAREQQYMREIGLTSEVTDVEPTDEEPTEEPEELEAVNGAS